MSSRQYKVISAAVGASAAIAMSVFGVAVSTVSSAQEPFTLSPVTAPSATTGQTVTATKAPSAPATSHAKPSIRGLRRCRQRSKDCRASRQAKGEVLGERLDDGAPHRFGQVVAHAVDDDEPRARDRPGQVAAVARAHHRIVGAVDDHRRRGDAAGVAQQAAGAEDRVELAQHALRVVASGAQLLDPAAQLHRPAVR